MIRRIASLLLASAFIAGCGTPASPDGGEDDFAQAGLAGGKGPLVDGKSLELVSWLVQFNRLNSPEKLEAMLNKTPGKFVPVDADADGTPDYIGVTEDPNPKRDKHALALTARASSATSEDEAIKIATLYFNEDWGLTGYERTSGGSRAASPTAIAAAAGSAANIAASQQANPEPEPAAAVAAVAPTDTPPEEEAAVVDAAPGKVPSVIAVPAGADEEAGLRPVD